MNAYTAKWRPPIGIALDQNRLIAALGRDEVWMRRLTPASDGDLPWSDLMAALEELKTVADSRAPLYISLLPPLAELRLLELRGLRVSEAARVVRRDPGRFFLAPHGPLDVELSGSGLRRTAPFVTVAAPRAIVEALGAAADASGWSLRGIVAAPQSWAAFLGASKESGRSRELVVTLDHQMIVLRARRGMIESLRRLPAHADIRQATLHPDAMLIGSADEAMSVAARFAPRAKGPRLLPASARDAVRRRRRRQRLVHVGTAAALLVLAAITDLARADAERARLAAERARIHGRVVQAAAVRESIAVLRDRVRELDTLASPPRWWSELIPRIGDALPTDAALLSLGGADDSVRIEGEATRAAPVFEALRTSGAVKSLAADGAIRQETRGELAFERFALIVRLTPTSAMRAAPNGSMP